MQIHGAFGPNVLDPRAEWISCVSSSVLELPAFHVSFQVVRRLSTRKEHLWFWKTMCGPWRPWRPSSNQRYPFCCIVFHSIGIVPPFSSSALCSSGHAGTMGEAGAVSSPSMRLFPHEAISRSCGWGGIDRCQSKTPSANLPLSRGGNSAQFCWPFLIGRSMQGVIRRVG